MGVINREDAIKKLNCHLKNTGYCECDKCNFDTSASIVDTLQKAISDMQKLEKIEKKFNNIGYMPLSEIPFLKVIIEIEQIVKE